MRRLMIIVIGLLGMVGLSSSARAAEQPAAIIDFAFEPASITVGIGDSVTWVNNGSTAHTVSSQADNEPFDSGSLGVGANFTHTFSKAGSFDFQCNVHPRMVGTVTVRAAEPALPSTSQPASFQTILILGAGLCLLLGFVARRRAAA